VEKHISSFLDFVVACEEYTPESQKLVEVFNLQKVIKGLENKRLGKNMGIQSLERRTNKLKQEEYNRWVGLYGNGNNYYANQ
jgi:hypothetical protein